MNILIINNRSKYHKNIVNDVLFGSWCAGKRIASAEYPPLPLLSVATVLEPDNKITFIDAQGMKLSQRQILDECLINNPDVLITQTSTMTFKEDIELLSKIKQTSPKIKTILVGSHITFLPRQSLSRFVDFVVLGEPEFSLRKLLKNIKNSPRVVKSKTPDIQKLPIPNRKYIFGLNYHHPLVRNKRWTTAETSRGCPGKCTFCTASRFYGNKVRDRSPDLVLEELRYLDSLGYKEVFFRDQTFTFSKSRTAEICRKIIDSGLKLDWICNVRPGTVDENLLSLMKEAGCHLIKVGVESGNQRILDNIKKMTTLEIIERTFKSAKKVGIDTHAHFMLGCIGETEKTISDTIKFAIKIDSDTATFGLMTPYPGTPIFDRLLKSVKTDGTEVSMDKLHLTSFYSRYFCNLLPQFLESSIKMAYLRFYFRPSFVLKRLMKLNILRDLSSSFDVLSLVFQ